MLQDLMVSNLLKCLELRNQIIKHPSKFRAMGQSSSPLMLLEETRYHVMFETTFYVESDVSNLDKNQWQELKRILLGMKESIEKNGVIKYYNYQTFISD